MEKDLKTSAIDIVIKTQQGGVIFEIKDPKRVNHVLFDDLKREISLYENNSIVIYPEQRIIDSQRVFIENTSHLI